MKNEILIPLIGLTPHGGNRVILQLANHLSNDFSVVLHTPYVDQKQPFNISPNVKIITHNGFPNNKFIRALFFVLLFPFIVSKKNARGFVVNHFLTVLPGLVLKYIFRKKVIFLIQGLEYKALHNKYLSIISLCITKLGVRFLDFVVVNATLDKEVYSIFGKKSIYSFNLGVDSRFILSDFIVSEKKYDIVYFLRRECYKGLIFFNEFLDKTNGKHKVLCVSQDIELLNNYSSISNVSVISPSNDKELIDAIDSAKICLYTSTYEGFGLPPLECMARGVPSVLFNSGGVTNYCIDRFNSLLVNTFSSDLLVDNVNEIFYDKRLLNRLSLNSRSTAKNNTFELQLEGFKLFLVDYLIVDKVGGK